PSFGAISIGNGTRHTGQTRKYSASSASRTICARVSKRAKRAFMPASSRKPVERGEHVVLLRHRALAADDRDRAAAFRAGQPRLAADEDADQRHAERGRQMQQPGIDADDELRRRDAARKLVERSAIGDARARYAGGDTLAALPLGLG